MDLDAYEKVHGPSWARLHELARRRPRTGAEADELVRLYQAVGTDLSTIRSSAPDADTVERLSQLVARGRAAVAGTHAPSWRDVTRFVGAALPAVLYRIRWWTAGVMTAFVGLALVTGWWVATHPAALEQLGTESVRRDYVENLFAAYYDPGVEFAATVWTNNAWVCALCVALGITGAGVVYVLVSNAVSIGSMGGLMAAYGELPTFLSLIAPHGLLELTCVFVAGAAGLKLFWTWIAPGPRPRGRALAEEGRALVTVAVGLAGALLVSGVVEGFVTGSSLPWPAKIAIGALVLAAFWAYVLVWGGRAVRAGETGDLEAERAGYAVATAG